MEEEKLADAKRKALVEGTKFDPNAADDEDVVDAAVKEENSEDSK